VGLKPEPTRIRLHDVDLSAEPLVGLKLPEPLADHDPRPFSRTPRGFEAFRRSRGGRGGAGFQPNPSWV